MYLLNIYIKYIFNKYNVIISDRKGRVLPSERNTNLENSMITLNCVQEADFPIPLARVMKEGNYHK